MPTLDSLIDRRDIHYSVVIPHQMLDVIARVGGLNPYGEPLYRLLLAQDRVMRASGDWTIWADNVPLDERGGFGIDFVQGMLSQFREVVETAIKRGLPRHEIEKIAATLSAEIDDHMNSKLAAVPLRTDSGMADIEIYPFEGWILEKWKTPESFGSEADWERYKFNGENALGPYPFNGEYELVAGPTPYMLTVVEVEDAIRQDFRTIQSRPRSARERVALLMSKMEQRRKQKARDQNNQAEAFQKDGPASLHNRLSLRANRVIQELAKKTGVSF